MNKEKKDYLTTSVSTFSCDITTSDAAGNVDFHMHNHHEIYLLTDGEIQYFVDNTCYPMTSGDLILFSDREIHKAINTGNHPFTRLVIHINPAFIRQYSTLQTNLLACFHRLPGEGNQVALTDSERKQLLTLATLLRQTQIEPEAYGNDLSALTTLIQILLLVNNAWKRTSPSRIKPQPHRAQAIMDYVEKHLTEGITLDSIAQALALDKYYLSHLFKEETESSIFQYILIKRIALAKELLLAGYTVSEVCHLSGFHDYSNFIRTFRQVTGVTPGRFQKQNR
ncbi:MAG: helix-turn-helix domain-containing protein [Lachnospiraceae bacterium]